MTTDPLTKETIARLRQLKKDQDARYRYLLEKFAPALLDAVEQRDKLRGSLNALEVKAAAMRAALEAIDYGELITDECEDAIVKALSGDTGRGLLEWCKAVVAWKDDFWATFPEPPEWLKG